MKHVAKPARRASNSRLPLNAFLFLVVVLCTPVLSQTIQNKPTMRPELVLQSGYAIYGASGMLFSPDARLLATWTFNSNGVKLWETATGRELRTLALGGTASAAGGFRLISLTGVSAVAFSRDGRLLAAGGRDNSIKIWNVVTGRELQTLAAAPTSELAASVGVFQLAFTPDARRLVSFGDAVRTWDVTTGGELSSSELSLLSAATSGGGFSNPFTLSPDGKQLAMLTRDFSQGSQKSIVVFRDLETGRAAQTVNAPSDFKSQGLASLAFAPDGRLLVASLDPAGGKNKFELWDFTSKNSKPRQLFTLDKSYGIFNFSADGRMLALAYGNQVKLFDTSTGAETKTLDVPNRLAKLMPDAGVTALAFSADGRTLATSSFDTEITLWETATGRRAGRLSSRTNMAYEVAFSADGTRLFTGSKTVWDLATGRGLRAVSANVESPFGILSRDGRQLASIPLKGSQVSLYDTANGRQLYSLTPQEKADSTNLVRFSPDGRLLATTYRADNPMQGVSTSSAEAKANNKEMQKQAQQAMKDMLKNAKTSGAPDLSSTMGGAMSGGGMMMPNANAPASIGSQVKLWDTATGCEARTINVPSGNPFLPATIHSVTFNADGSRLAVTNFNGSTVTLWDAATGARTHTLGASPAAAANPFGMPANISAMMGGGGGSTITSVAFSADSKLLLTGGAETSSNLDQGAMMRAMQSAMSDPKKARNSEAMMKEIYKDMKITTTGSVKVWDLSTGRELRTLAGHTSEVKAVAFSTDARIVAAAATDNTIKLWDAATGRELHTLRGHTSSINSIAFSPDARLLASASDDGSTVLWDATTGKQLATLVSLFDGADWLVVTPDGLFDGSPFAWNQILWRYDEDTFNVAPIEWFFNEFFYPGLLSDLAAGKRPSAATDFAQKDRRQPTVKISLADASTPAVAATTPDAPPALVVSTRDLKLKIEVSEAGADATHPSASGARDVRLFRNGALVRAWRGDVLPQGQSNATLEVTLPIVAGENRLTAYAFNRDNVKSKDNNLLITGADSLKRAGTAYILAVGVNLYANAGYNLKYAVADAREFGEEVRRQQSKLGRYERVEVVSLYDTQATKANILAALAKLSAQTQPEDSVVIYFAGHGTAQQNRFYLIPHDLGYAGSRTALTEAAVKDILSHSISDAELETAFERVPASQIMLVIDACNSGQALEAEEKRRGPMNSKGLAQLAYEKGMYILTAAQSFQAAQEASEVGHGLLTYALVEEGLKQSAADAQPQNGEILVREWFDYATVRVPTIQLQKLKQARDAGLNLSFVEASVVGDEERGLNLTKTATQRPRVFYRRELEAQPLIIARP
ncbi:MAG TPA: caspase family protein [Pyrinomonadaceae bacterium]|nr:caspase family protein [Pyrinomonadaceae bacterium]